MEEKIQARIAELEAELKRFLEMANKQVAAYEAAIGELKRLLAPPVEEPDYLPDEEE